MFLMISHFGLGVFSSFIFFSFVFFFWFLYCKGGVVTYSISDCVVGLFGLVFGGSLK